jgi:hypothetical protein
VGQLLLQLGAELCSNVSNFGDDRGHPDFEEIVMDDYRQDSTCIGITGPTPASFETMTPNDTATYRSWRRGVLAFYCSVAVLVGFAVLVSIPVQHREVAQLQGMPPVNVP